MDPEYTTNEIHKSHTHAITSLHSNSSKPFKFLIIISDAILSDIWIMATPGLLVKNFIYKKKKHTLKSVCKRSC